MARHTGGCLCGDIRYEIATDPAFAGFCHCKDCQRSSGGGHSTIGAFPREAITVTKGQTAKYESEGGSGGKVTREFCARCGSRLFSSSDRAFPLWMVAVGSLDDSSLLAPNVHIFGKDKAPWDYVHPEHMLFDHLPPGA
jgi:hypothetical protein